VAMTKFNVPLPLLLDHKQEIEDLFWITLHWRCALMLKCTFYDFSSSSSSSFSGRRKVNIAHSRTNIENHMFSHGAVNRIGNCSTLVMAYVIAAHNKFKFGSNV
jgi:hypothetical protein